MLRAREVREYHDYLNKNRLEDATFDEVKGLVKFKHELYYKVRDRQAPPRQTWLPLLPTGRGGRGHSQFNDNGMDRCRTTTKPTSRRASRTSPRT